MTDRRAGAALRAFTLGSSEGLQAEILTYGGILRRLTFPLGGVRRDLVLGLPDLDAYFDDTAHLGAITGRCANRIAGARFELDGRTWRLTANEGPNQLHGGRLGFGKRMWRVLEAPTPSAQRLLLGYRSPAGEEGYPGTLEVTAEFLVQPRRLSVRFESRCDAASVVNLTCHPYFNLSAGRERPAGEHLLRIPASHYLPVGDGAMLPTGDVAPVAGTPFDFRRLRAAQSPAPAAHAQIGFAGGGYDHCWVLDPDAPFAAELHSPERDVALRVASDHPAVQFYGAQHLPAAHPQLPGAVCLEPQGFPNAVNEPAFPSVIIRPGEVRSRTLTYSIVPLERCA